MAKEKLLSEHVSEFLSLMREALPDYDWCDEERSKCEMETQDILHTMELEDLKYGERAKLATELAKIRKYRRQCKDEQEELEPIVRFMKDNKPLFNKLDQLVGELRKVEKYHKTRHYYPRVRKEKKEKNT